MPVRRRIVGRDKYSNATLEVLAGDPLPWKYDAKEEAFWCSLDNGKVKYMVYHSRPEAKGAYRYWCARVLIEEPINLGDEYMIAWEGKEVCQIYESARQEKKETTLDAMKKIVIEYHTKEEGE